jgi:uncharacterized membrane protein YdjX (TVP38/TMEM64 family)
MKTSKILFIFVISALLLAFIFFDLQRYLTLEALKSQQASIESYRSVHPGLAIALYGLLYVAITGLSLPGATVLTLAGGALFGLFWGTLIVSFASTIGATLAFLAARFLFRDLITSRFSQQIQTIDEGINREGAFYLFTLRLVPLFPFFMINLAMGLTAIRAGTFYWVSQIGMLAGTLVYVNAGTQLAKIESLSGILSPALVGSFTLLGVFPILAKKVVGFIKS